LQKEFQPKEIGRYYPSEIGRCLRNLYYSYKYPVEVKPKLLKIFELGNIMHDFIVRVLKSEKIPEVELLDYEIPIKLEVDDFVISGRIDDLILLKTDNRKILVEVKSCKDVKAVQKPQNSHLIQLQFYMHVTGIHEGLLLYIDKTTLETKTFKVEYDEHWSKLIIERFRMLHKALKNDELPRAEAKLIPEISWMCNFCEYKEKCERNEK
jgi:CRISPR/Cas system-associated exonuclease Cas4 (RecB family)